MQTRLASVWAVSWQTARASFADGVPRLGASLAFYTLFAIGPILLIATAVTGAVFGRDAAQGEIIGQLERLIGSEGARAVQSMLAAAGRNTSGGILATVMGTLTLIVGATGAFLELQAALNVIWRVKPKPGFSIKTFFGNRLRSFGLVLGVGFLLLVSLVVSAGLAAFGRWLGGLDGLVLLWNGVDLVVSLCVFTVMFAALYRFLPDVKLRWRDVWMGAFATALLFSIGKSLIGLYLGQSSMASSYGPAGSVIVLLLWVYYSSQIVLFGAEFTRIWTEHAEGLRPAPEPYAEKQRGAGETR